MEPQPLEPCQCAELDAANARIAELEAALRDMLREFDGYGGPMHREVRNAARRVLNQEAA